MSEETVILCENDADYKEENIISYNVKVTSLGELGWNV